METFEYFFFRFQYSCQIWTRLLTWLGKSKSIRTWQQEMAWICRYATNKTGVADIACSIFAMMIYCIWRDGNQLRFQHGLADATKTCREIALHIHIRGRDIVTWQNMLRILNCFP